MLSKSTSGYYVPSYFYIYIKSHGSITHQITNPTVLHEVIHYMQDLSLSYNLMMAIDTLNDFWEFKKTHYLKTVNITRPVKFTPRKKKAIFDNTWGCNNFIADELEILEITKSNPIEDSNKTYHKYNMVLRDNKKQQPDLIYQIGARDLLEYIADTIECSTSPRQRIPYPYLTLDYIFSHKKLDYISFEDRIFIATISLHTCHPIETFIEILDKLANPTVCIKTVKNGLELHDPAALLENLDSFLKCIYTGPQLSDVSDWFSQSKEYIKNNLGYDEFFAGIFAEKTSYHHCNNLLRGIGLPFFINSKNFMESPISSHFNTDHFLQLYVMNKFLDYLSGTEKKCTMYEFCEANNPSIINTNCEFYPHMKAKENELCPLGKFIKIQGLSNVKF